MAARTWDAAEGRRKVTMIPRIALLLFLAGWCSLGAQAGTLPRDQVAADAKWLFHLDVDALVGTELGKFFAREFIDPQAAKVAGNLRRSFGIEFDWRQIHAITAYGLDFREPEKANGVLLVRSDLDVPAALEQVLEKLAAAGGGGDAAPLRKVQDTPFPIFCFQDSIYGAPVGKDKDLFAVARSVSQLEKAARVIEGKAPNIASSDRLPLRPGQPAGFLTVAIADAAAAGAGLPPQARVLKEARGLQLIAGEKADKVFINAALDAKDAEVAEQLQQTLLGAIALAKLSDVDNKDLKDLQQLAQTAKVGGNQKTVTLDLQVPVSDVIDKVGKTQKKRRG